MLAFTLLGLAGAIAKPFKNRLVGVAVGTAAVCGIRFLCSFLSGVLIWGNLSDGLPAWTYSLTYNGSYNSPESFHRQDDSEDLRERYKGDLHDCRLR